MKTTIARFLSLMIMMSLTMVIFGKGMPEKLEAVAKEKSGIFKVTACPTGNITFTSQAQIDAFPATYPGCTQITGTVIIQSAGITNLLGLSQLTSITGMLDMQQNSFTSLAGLQNLVSIGGPLRIKNNTLLSNIDDLINLETIGGELEIWFSNSLTNVNGLGNLRSIGIFLSFVSNPILNSLDGLHNLTSMNGHILLQQNNALTDLSGLEGICTGLTGVNINTNPVLSDCTISSICSYLQVPANSATVFGNSGNCATRAAIEASCPTCPVGNVTLNTQAQIDAFPINYPGCTKITGDLRIESSMVNNLAPLSQLTCVTGHVYIEHTPLTSLNGLHNITNIGGRLNFFDNPFLTSLNGLSSLTSIGVNLQLWLLGSLTSLSGLSNLTSVGTDIAVGHCNQLTNLNGLHNVTSSNNIWIELNTALTSLNGLHNLGPVLSLTIKNNSMLSECEILPICNFVGNYTKTVTIFGNAPNCNSRSAVAAQCASIPTCPPGDVELANQNQVVAFGEIYPDCHVINGKLKMYGSVTSLLPLSQINQVNSWLDIRVPGLTSLQGLEGITTVGVHLNIFSCSSLPNLNGLNNLTSIGGELSVWASGNLTSMAALSNVTHIGGLIQIGFNNLLPNLNGLQNVTSTVGALIRNNPVLNNIDGIVNINLTFLDIQNNTSLSSCSIANVCSYLGVPANSATIVNNGVNCASRAAIQANCFCTVPAPGNTIASATTICLGSTVNLSLQNATVGNGVSYQWFNTSGPIQNGTSATYTSPPLTNNETFYCQVTCSVGPSMTTSAPVSISISAIAPPNGGTASGPANSLTHSNTPFNTVGSYGTLQWQGANTVVPITFVNLPGLTSSSAAFNFNGPGTYFIRCKASVPGCPDAYSNEVTVSIAVNGDNVCEAIPLSEGNNGTYTNLSATGEAGEVSPPLIGCTVQNGWCSSSNSVINSVWFTFTPAISGKYEFRLNPSLQIWDSQFALYAAPSCTPFTNFALVAANDDRNNNAPFDSHILPVCLSEGVTYYLKVDGYGNTQAAVWGIQVNKAVNAAPTFSNCPANLTICGTNVATFTPPFASDDCGTVTVSSNYNSGDIFPNGNTLVTFIATDVEGASSSCSFTVNVSPLLSACPPNMTVCGSNIANFTAPTSFESCGLVNISSNYEPGDEFPAGTTTVTYTATNQGGSSASCSFTVTVRELLTPCPENFTFCGGTTVFYTEPTSYEDCGLVTISSNYHSGDEFPSGVTTVTYTATNQAGNSAFCSFEVKVSPEINFDATIVQPVCATYVGFVSLQATGGIPPLTYSPLNPGTANLSAGTYIYLVTDAYGCTAEAIADIVAPANPCLPPLPVCGNIITVYANAGNLAFNGPGTADVYLIQATDLDGGTFSLLPGTLTRQVKRANTNVAFNWTTNGACVDATPNGIYNNNDKGLVFKNCVPVTPADFNLTRNFDMTLTDFFGTSTCSGRYKVIFGYPPGATQPENGEETEAYTRTLDEESEFQVFPNPGTNQVFIATTMKEGEVYSLSVLDAFGKEVKRFDQIDNGFMSIETTDLVPGAYTMMLRGGETIKTLKWLKME